MATKQTTKTASPKRKPALPPRLSDTTLRRLVFQTFGRARKTQDSPIVPDVWMKYIRVAESIAHEAAAGQNTSARKSTIDLLLTPWSGTSPGDIVHRLTNSLGERSGGARIAQCTSRVVAQLDFATLIGVVVPMSGWWQRFKNEDFWRTDVSKWMPEKTSGGLMEVFSQAGTDIEFLRYAALAGFVQQLLEANTTAELKAIGLLARRMGPTPEQDEAAERDNAALPKLTVDELKVLLELYGNIMKASAVTPPPATPAPKGQRPVKIYLINLNRTAAQTVFDSRKTVKADAAERVFDIATDGITFAVIDGGIDATHLAFRKPPTNPKDPNFSESIPKKDLAEFSRIAATYDFTILRDLIATRGKIDDADPDVLPPDNKAAIERIRKRPGFADAMASLETRAHNARDLDWHIVEPLISILHTEGNYEVPGSDHGTHVAGILAAHWPSPDDSDEPLIGMCRNLTLYDLRVFDKSGKGDEFSILCAIEFVGWLNRDRQNPVIHGANLSLALRHDVDSFACGQTPICEACNHLVGSGTVVVAAAGNSGFDGAAEKQSLGNGYRMISITDPGNAESVITVGATHRRDPHAYGVSYFSARGPTGDGRLKPDILAPGEKITSTIRDGRSQRMDGTSMAAPHVSGAAALLMARYPELIGRPGRIKEILMSTATDLKREPYFQGAGLLDVLRALQSV